MSCDCAAFTLLDFEIRLNGYSQGQEPTSLQEKCITAMAQAVGCRDEVKYLKLPDGCPSILYNRMLALTIISVANILARAALPRRFLTDRASLRR
jgi:hypothetical protein